MLSIDRRRFVALSATTVVAARAHRSMAQETPSLSIAASTPIIADIVRAIAGGDHEVWSVIPDGADPHTWEATPREMARAAESDSFISVGAYLEPFIEAGPWRRAVVDGGVPELVLADHLELIAVDRIIDHGDHVHDLTSGDPHFWLDPLMVRSATPAVVNHLSDLMPEQAETFRQNGEVWDAEIDTLHAELEDAFAAIPVEDRRMIVFHDAYTYFAARYDFEVIGVVLPAPETEPSAQEFAELERVIVDNDVDVVFVEPQFSIGTIDGLVEQHDLATALLLTDTFDGEVDSYLALMRFNRDSLVRHLG